MAKVGIDFGTTNSSLVAYDKKRNIFEYFGSELEREKPTPSVVWYHDNHVDVGRLAKDNYNKYCDVPGNHMEKSIKSKLGSNNQVSIFGQLTDPHIVGSEIIKHLKNIAERNLAFKRGISVDNAVFSVPVNFSGEYTGAAEPQFRCGVSHLSGTGNHLTLKNHSLSFLSKP